MQRKLMPTHHAQLSHGQETCTEKMHIWRSRNPCTGNVLHKSHAQESITQESCTTHAQYSITQDSFTGKYHIRVMHRRVSHKRHAQDSSTREYHTRVMHRRVSHKIMHDSCMGEYHTRVIYRRGSHKSHAEESITQVMHK